MNYPTVDKMKILGITIPTNGKYEDLIKLNYDEKNVTDILDVNHEIQKKNCVVHPVFNTQLFISVKNTFIHC
jgi:hypothetical protein